MENLEISDDGNELDVIFKTFRQSIPKRLSTYNNTMAFFGESDEWENYEKQLQKEIKDWNIIWRKTLRQMNKTKSPEPILDISILPRDKLDYINAAPNLRLFIRESLELRRMYVSLRSDYGKICKTQKELYEMCKCHVNESKVNLLKKQFGA